MSEIRDLIRKAYRDYIETEYSVPTELRLSLRTHERVPVFVDNMARELSRPGLNLKRETLIMCVRDMTRFFIENVKRAAEERTLSPLAKSLLKKRVDDMKDFRRQAEALENEGKEHVATDKAGETHRQSLIVDEFM